MEQLDALEILPLLERGEWIKKKQDGSQGGKSGFWKKTPGKSGW